MPSLNRIVVRGFKSIKDMDLKLRSLNVLIGANGAGKSNFISLFNIINKIIERKLELFVAQAGGVDFLLYFGQKTTRELSVELYFGRNSYQFGLVPTLGNTLIFSKEYCLFQGYDHPEPYYEPLGTGYKETKLQEVAKRRPGKVADHILDTIKNWKVYHFHDTSDTSKMRSFVNISDNFTLKQDASNIAAFLFLLQEKHPAHYENIVDTIRLVAPFFDDFILRPDPHNNNLIQLEWREKGSDAYFNAHSFSDGTLRFICLATLLLQPDLPSVILLDEPELGLHPYAITLLAGLLQSTAAKTQVIVSTQSVTLVNQLKIEDVIVVDREEGQSIFKHLKEENMKAWLEEYGIGDLWEKNFFGGRP